MHRFMSFLLFTMSDNNDDVLFWDNYAPPVRMLNITDTCLDDWVVWRGSYADGMPQIRASQLSPCGNERRTIDLTVDNGRQYAQEYPNIATPVWERAPPVVEALHAIGVFSHPDRPVYGLPGAFNVVRFNEPSTFIEVLVDAE
jgi:hypothetical protein